MPGRNVLLPFYLFTLAHACAGHGSKSVPLRGDESPHSKMTALRKSTLYFLLLVSGTLVFILLAGYEALRSPQVEERLAKEGRLVRTLGLTDLCLFTEARFTRHLSLADRHAAFQEGPGARDLFPSGSLTVPRSQALKTEF